MAGSVDVAVIGAGPVGLAAAIGGKRAGLRVRVVDRGTLVNTIARFPTDMTFFSEGRNIEIAGHPMIHAGSKPTRKEALAYYRRVTEVAGVDVRTFSEVTGIEGQAGEFRLALRPVAGGPQRPETTLQARAVIVATGYFDCPERLEVPGEDLAHVTCRYGDCSRYWGNRVAVIGGSNSGVETALELFRGGATVTLIHRNSEIRPSVKYWLKPDFEHRVREGSIDVLHNASIRFITPEAVVADVGGQRHDVAADFVIVLIGYRANDRLLRDAGATFTADGERPVLSDCHETSVRGLYAIGSAGFGRDTRTVFIENGRHHAAAAIEGILRQFAGG